MASTLINQLKHKATDFKTLAGIVIPQPRISVSGTNAGIEAMIPFPTYRMRGLLVSTTNVSGSWQFDLQTEDITGEIDTGALSMVAHSAVDGKYFVIPVGHYGGYYVIGGSSWVDIDSGNGYKITVAEDASDVFSLRNDDRLPQKCRGVVPYLYTTGATTGESGTIDWWVVVDALEEF